MCVKKICNVNNVGQLIKLIYVTSKFGWSHNIRILSGFLWTRGESYTEKAINAAVSYQLLPFKYISTFPTPFCTTGSEFLGNIHVYTKIHTLRTSMRISCTKNTVDVETSNTRHIYKRTMDKDDDKTDKKYGHRKSNDEVQRTADELSQTSLAAKVWRHVLIN